jgi:hypothetical protein
MEIGHVLTERRDDRVEARSIRSRLATRRRVLRSAGAISVASISAGAALSWYPVALAGKLAGPIYPLGTTSPRGSTPASTTPSVSSSVLRPRSGRYRRGPPAVVLERAGLGFRRSRIRPPVAS